MINHLEKFYPRSEHPSLMAKGTFRLGFMEDGGAVVHGGKVFLVHTNQQC